MKLIIMVPCYNEEGTLKIALDNLPKQLNGIDLIEYLIIDDGSQDGTIRVAQEWGINYIIRFKKNMGLAKGFLAGIDASIKNGADIIVNTDADNQYCGEDIQKLIDPILSGDYDIVVGKRPIDTTRDFSLVKKKLQHIGSGVVRLASHTEIPDAPSGFRAFSKEAAMRLNVINTYTYTLETIIQAGREGIAMTSVPIRTNGELRKSRLSKSIGSYVRRSCGVIIRSFIMYKPLKFFVITGAIPFVAGVLIGIRFLAYFWNGTGSGHVQSLILAAILLMLGYQTFMVGFQADIIAANRKIIQDIQYRVKQIELELINFSDTLTDFAGTESYQNDARKK